MVNKRSQQNPRPVIADPLAVIPRRPENVEMKRDSRGMVHLRVWEEPKGFKKTVARWLHYDYSRKIELDEHGSCYYEQVDGVKTLKEIIAAMMARFGQSRDEASQSVLLFTKQLMAKNLLQLVVPDGACARKNDGRQ